MRGLLGAGILAAALCGFAAGEDDLHSAAPWLENFHHAEVPQGPVEPTRITPVDQLDGLQHETMRLVRQARESDNFYAATDAIAEARANAEAAAVLAAPQPTVSPLYLFALSDETVRPAVAWWVEGKTLHYVTPGGKQAEAPLDAVDHALTERLNAERNVRLQLPPPRP